MTSRDRETMNRALGMLEGLSWVADENISQALDVVCVMLHTILKNEEKPDEV